MNAALRKAWPGDEELVRFVGFATWPSTYGPAKGARFVTRGLDHYWNHQSIHASIAAGHIDVVTSGDEISGMVEVAELDDALVMWKLYVVPWAQGQGLGAALVSAAKERARAASFDLYTEHEPENTAAALFYQRQGFQPTDAPWTGTDAIWLLWRQGGQN